jgi:hypothetical protein
MRPSGLALRIFCGIVIVHRAQLMEKVRETEAMILSMRRMVVMYHDTSGWAVGAVDEA